MIELKTLNNVKNLVSQANLIEALDLLQKFIVSQKKFSLKFSDNILYQINFYNDLKSKRSNNAIRDSEFNIEIKRFVHSLLLLIKNVEDDVKSQTKSKTLKLKTVEEPVEKKKIKIAIISANPKNENPLRLEKEIRDIRGVLKNSIHKGFIEIEFFTAVRIQDLQNCLLEYMPNFVHFAGHGNHEGIALIHGLTENAQIVNSEPLANLFKLFSNNISCVFLNSCYSNNQAKQIRKYIPHVIGMTDEVPDDTAVEFATTFYNAIAAGRDIAFSFEFAKNSIDLHKIPGRNIPILL